jgi:hypothetical protein
MTRWWAFPPSTTKLQVDEKWSFVTKKQKHCDDTVAADAHCGDRWDHVALDPDSRLVLDVLVGPRTTDTATSLLSSVRDRLGDRTPTLVNTDEHAPYWAALLLVFGQVELPPRTGRGGRPADPYVVPPVGMCYGTVHKTRRRGRVTAIERRVVFGELAAGERISTSYLERQHATDRHRNARKTRKTYRFSKDERVHEAMTCYTLFSYNFCWPVRTLRVRDDHGQWQPRTPAMVAGLTDHIWSLHEWLTFPVVQR